MTRLNDELEGRLSEIRRAGLHRSLRRVDSAQSAEVLLEGRKLLNFSSNDYLGLANHPALKEASIRAVKDFGAGAGASRLVCGSLAPCHQLEETLAQFKGAEACLTFSSGYAAASGTLCALLSKEDVIILDKLVHASVIDAARLSGAKLRVFAHNDLNELEAILQWADRREVAKTNASFPNQAAASQSPNRPNKLIVTESVFSMDGDPAPLREIVELKERYGAWLMVDEAHATGLFGSRRRGLVESAGLSEQIELQMGTLGKAVGASGGYICGSGLLIEYLINRARTLIFSTAPVPAAAAAALAGIRLIQSEEGKQRCQQLWKNVDQIVTGLGKPMHGLIGASAILPIIIGDEVRAVEMGKWLSDQGILIPAIRYPTVARGSARLRLTVSAEHKPDHVKQLLATMEQMRGRLGLTELGSGFPFRKA